MNDLRTAAQQALEALVSQFDGRADAIDILSDALAQQAEPQDAYGYASRVAVSIWQWNYKDTAPNWKPLDDLMGVLTQIDNMTSGLTRRAQQAEPVEPVAWMFELARNFNLEGYGGWEKRVTEYRPNTPEGSVRNVTPLSPQRKPLTEEEIDAVWDQWFGAYGLRGPGGPYTRRGFARAIERAHGITDPQIADRLARHGIPMPEGDPK